MTILIIILILIAIPFIGAAFLSNDYVIEQEITIDKPNREVFDYIKFLRNSDKYNKWVMIDPNVKRTFSGTDGTVGFVYGWDSDNKQVGKGEQEITKIQEGERIDYALRFIKPFENVAGSHITTEPLTAGQSRVKWFFTGTRNYKFKIFHFLFNLKKVLGKDLHTSLTNLKTLLEK